MCKYQPKNALTTLIIGVDINYMNKTRNILNISRNSSKTFTTEDFTETVKIQKHTREINRQN